MLHSVDEANSPVAAMTHHVFEVPTNEAKRAVVHRLASGSERRILFTRTKHQARKLAKQLTVAGIPAVDLHGNLAQPARDRNLATFASGAAKVLVATDVAARGVHVDGVELVVHVDPPAEHKAYLHRSGRTARAGNAGDVITLVLPDQRGDLAALMRKAQIKFTPQSVTPDSPAVAQLVGVAAPLVPVSESAPNRPAAPARGRKVSAGEGRTASGGPRSSRAKQGAAAARRGEVAPRRAAGGGPTRCARPRTGLPAARTRERPRAPPQVAANPPPARTPLPARTPAPVASPRPGRRRVPPRAASPAAATPMPPAASAPSTVPVRLARAGARPRPGAPVASRASRVPVAARAAAATASHSRGLRAGRNHVRHGRFRRTPAPTARRARARGPPKNGTIAHIHPWWSFLQLIQSKQLPAPRFGFSTVVSDAFTGSGEKK